MFLGFPSVFFGFPLVSDGFSTAFLGFKASHNHFQAFEHPLPYDATILDVAAVFVWYVSRWQTDFTNSLKFEPCRIRPRLKLLHDIIVSLLFSLHWMLFDVHVPRGSSTLASPAIP